nr:hypothetical protein [Thermoactinospora rubra]
MASIPRVLKAAEQASTLRRPITSARPPVGSSRVRVRTEKAVNTTPIWARPSPRSPMSRTIGAIISAAGSQPRKHTSA